jgi:hypothetical protein
MSLLVIIELATANELQRSATSTPTTTIVRIAPIRFSIRVKIPILFSCPDFGEMCLIAQGMSIGSSVQFSALKWKFGVFGTK